VPGPAGSRWYAQAVATGNITLSGTQTIDGQAAINLGAGVLCVAQTNPVENGLWAYGLGAWVRLATLPAGANADGVAIHVSGGTAYKGTTWICVNVQNAGTAVVGTSALTFQIAAPAGLYSSTIVLNGATPIDVALPAITAANFVMITPRTRGGTPGIPPTVTISAGVGFTVTGVAGDTSTYAYRVI